MMLDTNPCFNVIIKHLETLYPDHSIIPYFPPSKDPAKFCVIIVPTEYVIYKLNDCEILQMINQESIGIMNGKISDLQKGLHELKNKLNLKVICLEDFFVEQVENELAEAGYETEIYYHNSFVCSVLKKSSIKQDLLYKPVTDIFTVRQWNITDQKFLESLFKKGLTLPDHFNEEFLISMRKKQQKILGAEILVINAKKI